MKIRMAARDEQDQKYCPQRAMKPTAIGQGLPGHYSGPVYPWRAFFILFHYSGADFWQNRGFNDKSVKTSKIVALDLLIKIGYGPIA